MTKQKKHKYTVTVSYLAHVGRAYIIESFKTWADTVATLDYLGKTGVRVHVRHKNGGERVVLPLYEDNQDRPVVDMYLPADFNKLGTMLKKLEKTGTSFTVGEPRKVG